MNIILKTSLTTISTIAIIVTIEVASIPANSGSCISDTKQKRGFPKTGDPKIVP